MSLSSVARSTIKTGSEKPDVKRAVGRPRQLSMTQILEAAETIGMEKLTLQGVAEILGVTTPALYRHVQNREDLLAKYAMNMTARFPISAYGGGDWSVWVRGYAEALIETYVSVPGLADYSIRSTPTVRPILERHEMSITAAKQSGFDEVSALYATRAIIEFVAGWVARIERRKVTEREQGVHPDQEFRDQLKATGDDYPNLKSAMKAVKELDTAERLDFTLTALILGLTSLMQKTRDSAVAVKKKVRRSLV